MDTHFYLVVHNDNQTDHETTITRFENEEEALNLASILNEDLGSDCFYFVKSILKE